MQGSGSTGSGPASADAVNTDALNTEGATERIAIADLEASGVDDPDDRGAEDTQVIDTTGGAAAPTGGGRSPGLIAAIVGGALLLVLAVVYLVDLLSTSGEIERNTTIAGVEVGGMTPEQATAALTAGAVPAYQQPMTIDVHGIPTPLDPVAAGLTPDVSATVQAAVPDRRTRSSACPRTSPTPRSRSRCRSTPLP